MMFNPINTNSNFQLEVRKTQVLKSVRDLTLLDSKGFEALLPAGVLKGIGNKHAGSSQRKRSYPMIDTMFAWCKQALSSNKSCRATVINLNKLKGECGLPVSSENNGGYCAARMRIPEELPKDLSLALAADMQECIKPNWLWKGREVKTVDGSKVTMLDTPANQREYPQPTTQKNGAGFPQARLVVVSSLSVGTHPKCGYRTIRR